MMLSDCICKGDHFVLVRRDGGAESVVTCLHDPGSAMLSDFMMQIGLGMCLSTSLHSLS
jgi:hypothetical protein